MIKNWLGYKINETILMYQLKNKNRIKLNVVIISYCTNVIQDTSMAHLLEQ